MKLRIVGPANRMPSWVTVAYDDYAKRVPREFALDRVDLRAESRERGRTSTQMFAAEAVRIRTACAGYSLVALDERGDAWTTRLFADHLSRWRTAAVNVAFAIGSADGLDATLKAQAVARVALSALTLPHAMVRVLLVEQIYRAASLLAGHPYHRE